MGRAVAGRRRATAPLAATRHEAVWRGQHSGIDDSRQPIPEDVPGPIVSGYFFFFAAFFFVAFFFAAFFLAAIPDHLLVSSHPFDGPDGPSSPWAPPHRGRAAFLRGSRVLRIGLAKRLDAGIMPDLASPLSTN
jgi:hypothetical protein